MAFAKQQEYYREADEYYKEDEIKPIYICNDCEQGIYEGDRSWWIGGHIYCEDCAKDGFSKLA